MIAADLDNLYEEGVALTLEYQSDYASEHVPEEALAEFFARVKGWADRCIHIGRFLQDGTAERRALQGQVDYWTSLMRRSLQSADETRLKEFDPTASVPLEAKCPYPGLRAFGSDKVDSKQQAADIALFFGRDDDIRACMKILGERTVLSIVQDSGAGKSSLVMAGILPKMRKRKKSERILVPRMTPGSDPVANLGRALGSVFGEESVRALLAELARLDTPELCKDAVAQWLEGRSVVLFIDQFEELFSLCRDESRRQAFASALLAFAGDVDDARWPVRIIITMRLDHLPALQATTPKLSALMGRGEHRPEPLDHACLVSVIEEPASVVGLRFVPPSLIDKLADSAAGLPAGLALLQFALYRLWTRRQLRPDGKPCDMVTEADVAALPSVRGALGAVADELYEKLDQEGQGICRRLMLELTEIAENMFDPLRKRRDEDELRRAICADLGATDAAVGDIIDRFVDAGLLMRLGGGARQVEVSHEALLTHWGRYRNDWLLDKKADLMSLKIVEREAAAWRHARASMPDDAANRLKQEGTSLEDARKLARNHWLNRETRSYVAACIVKIREKNQADARAARELAAAKRSARKWRIGLGVFSAVLLLAGMAWSIQQVRATSDAAMLNFATLADRFEPREAVRLAAYLAENEPDDRFVRTLRHAHERVIDSISLPDRPSDVQFVSGGAGIIQESRSEASTAASSLTQYVRLELIDKKGESGAALTFKPPGRGYTLAAIAGGKAIEIAEPDEGGGQRHVWVAWRRVGKDAGAVATHVSTEGAPAPIIVQVYALSGGAGTEQPNLLHAFELSGNGNHIGSIDVRPGHGGEALITILERPSPDALPKSTHVHHLSVTSEGFDDTGLDPQCSAGKSDKTFDGASDITATMWLDPAKCPVRARNDGVILCPDGQMLKAQSKSADQPPVARFYPSERYGVFATVDYAENFRLWQCPKEDEPNNPAHAVHLAEEQPTGVAFDSTRLIAVINGRFRCWDGAERNGRPVEAVCFPSVNAFQVAVRPDDNRLLYLAEPGTPLVRRRLLGVDKAEAGRADKPYVTVNSANAPNSSNVGIRYMPTASHAIMERSNDGQHWSEFKPAQDLVTIMYAALSGDGRTLVYAGIKSGKPPSIRVFMQRLGEPNANPSGKDDPNAKPIPLGMPEAIQFVGRTRLALATDDGVSPTVFLAVGDALFYRKAVDSAWTRRNLPNESHVESAKEKEINCLAASANGKWVVLGTRMHQLFEFSPSAGKWQVANLPHQEDSPITACAVSDDGDVAFGDEKGKVYLVHADRTAPGKMIEDEMTTRAVLRMPTAIAAVSIDPGGQYLSALGEQQSLGCGENGLPGQTLRIWRLHDSTKGHIPLSNRCFVDGDIKSIDPVTDNGIKLYLSNGKIEDYPCTLCGRDGRAKVFADQHETDKETAPEQRLTPERVEKLFGFHKAGMLDRIWLSIYRSFNWLFS